MAANSREAAALKRRLKHPPEGFAVTVHKFGAFVLCDECCQGWRLSADMIGADGGLKSVWAYNLRVHHESHAARARLGR